MISEGPISSQASEGILNLVKPRMRYLDLVDNLLSVCTKCYGEFLGPPEGSLLGDGGGIAASQ